MALDLLLTSSPNALKYAKQVLINSSLLEIYQRNGGDKLLENDPDGIFKCVEVIKDGIKNFNSVVEECILINEKNWLLKVIDRVTRALSMNFVLITEINYAGFRKKFQ